MKQLYHSFFAGLFLHLLFSFPVYSQCTLPAGAIKIDSLNFKTVSSINSGQVYYVAPGGVISVNHSGLPLTISGKILVMQNGVLMINMGVNSITMGVSGTVEVCDGGRFDIAPGHDLTLNGNNPSPTITLGLNAHINMCTMHDIKFNTGKIYMNDYSSLEFGNYHNLGSNSSNLIVYTGTGTVGIASGNPMFHTGGDDFYNYANTNNFASIITNSSHIDYVNDNLGSDKPGSANYCGPKTAPTYAACRTQWSSMPVTCGSAMTFLYVLPLHLTQFISQLKNDQCKLQWSAVNTEGLDHFELERSAGNESFAIIASILPNHNSDNANNYTYPDPKPVFADTKYRLKMVGKDGKISFSEILSVSIEKTNANTINSYPNPFTDKLQVSTNFSKSAQAVIELFNMSGNRVKALHFTITAGLAVSGIYNLSSLPAGIYMMKIKTNEKSYYQKIVKK